MTDYGKGGYIVKDVRCFECAAVALRLRPILIAMSSKDGQGQGAGY